MEHEHELEDQEHELGRRGRRGGELLGALIYAAVTLAVSYYTLHPEEARRIVLRFTRRPMPAHQARAERIVADFRREFARWEHERRER